MSFVGIAKETYLIIVLNAITFVAIFTVAYKRKGLE